MTSITAKLHKLRQLQEQTNLIRQNISNAKAKISINNHNNEYSSEYNNTGSEHGDSYDRDVANNNDTDIIRSEMFNNIKAKQKMADIALERKQHVDGMISNIMSSMPKIDYEAEAMRLILKDGKSNLASAISSGYSLASGSSIDKHNTANNIKKISVYDGPEDTINGELSDISDCDLSDGESFNLSDSETDGIEIDESKYPHLDPIRTRPNTPELDNISSHLTDEQIQKYVNKEYDRSIKIVKCWCIMANNAGYQLFSATDIEIIKKHLTSYQVIATLDRNDIDSIEWQGMFIQWLYIDTNHNTSNVHGAICRFARGWVLKYYPNYYSNGSPRLIVSTRYQPDFTNEKRTSAIYKSGYTQSISLDGTTPIFRHITSGDVASELFTTYGK